ncbi:MAG: leucine-rich repeat domain-containing protein [Nanoarchaeota archaeon]
MGFRKETTPPNEYEQIDGEAVCQRVKEAIPCNEYEALSELSIELERPLAELLYENIGINNGHVTHIGNIKKTKGKKHIPPSIKNFEELTWLNLSNLNIETISEDIRYLDNLRDIFLNINELRKPAPISRIAPLNSYNIAGNKIQDMEDTLENRSSLEHLSLGYNKLETLPEYIAELPQLNYLSFPENKITTLTENQMRNFYKLHYYDGTGNPFKGISKHNHKLIQKQNDKRHEYKNLINNMIR